MAATLERFLTIGEICRRTDRDIHQIEYLVRSRGIKPRGMEGNARVLAEADVDLIAHEIRQIEFKRRERTTKGRTISHEREPSRKGVVSCQ
jgi:hypothetical protein